MTAWIERAERDGPPRISIVGISGSGKSTLGAALGARYGVPHLELDSVFHQPGWTPLETEAFRARVRTEVAAPGWVVDGNYYSRVQDLVWGAARLVVWIDLPRRQVMRNIVPRTLARVFSRRELWNGNREPWGNLFRWDPEENVMRWAWTRHGPTRERYARLIDAPEWSHLEFVRLTSRAAVTAACRAAAR